MQLCLSAGYVAAYGRRPARAPAPADLETPEPERIAELYRLWAAAPDKHGKNAVICSATLAELGPLCDLIDHYHGRPATRPNRPRLGQEVRKRKR